jgi:hypothetical protein
MKQKEWFAVGVRLVGVWALYSGIQELIALVETRFAMVTATHTTLGAYFFHAAVEFAVGAYFISGAAFLVNTAFSNESSEDEES